MLVDTLKWRIEFKVDDVTKEEFPKDIFENLGHIYGTDKGGRSVTYVEIYTACILRTNFYMFSYNIYGGNQDLKAVFGDTTRFIRFAPVFLFYNVPASF